MTARGHLEIGGVPLAADTSGAVLPALGVTPLPGAEAGQGFSEGVGMRIVLPWPPTACHPNHRVHWRTKAAEMKKARAWGKAAALAAGAQTMTATSLRVALEFQPPTTARRDTDNMLAACKGLLDGLSDALGVDDSAWTISLSRGPVVKGGAVIATVEPIE